MKPLRLVCTLVWIGMLSTIAYAALRFKANYEAELLYKRGLYTSGLHSFADVIVRVAALGNSEDALKVLQSLQCSDLSPYLSGIFSGPYGDTFYVDVTSSNAFVFSFYSRPQTVRLLIDGNRRELLTR